MNWILLGRAYKFELTMSLLNLAAYKILIEEIKFDEYPIGFIPEQGYLNKPINYNDTDIDLNMYLAQLILCNDWLGRIAYYLRSKDGVNWKAEAGEA